MNEVLILLITKSNTNIANWLSNISNSRWITQLCSSGSDIIQLIEQHRYNMILFDANLDNCNHIEILHRIKLTPKYIDIPIVSFGENVCDEKTLAFLENGTDDFIALPIHEQIFSLKIKKIYQNARLTQNLHLEIEKYEKSQNEQKQIETALRESEIKYRMLTENISDIVWAVDMNLNYTYISPCSEKLFGFTVEEQFKAGLALTFTPESFEKIKQTVAKNLHLLYTGSMIELPVRMELEGYKKNGSSAWLEITANLITQENGVPIGIQGTTKDITARKKTELALRESEETLRLALNSFSSGLFKYWINDKRVEVDERIKQLFELDDDPKWNRRSGLFSLMHPEDIIPFQLESKKYLITGGTFSKELRVIINKELKWMNINAIISPDRQPEIIGVISDITRQKQIEESLRKNEQLFRSMVEAAPAPLLISDFDGNIVFANSTYLDYFGYQADDITQLNTKHLYANQKDREIVIAQLRETGILPTMELQAKRKNGERFDIMMTAKVGQYSNKEVIFSSIYDITKLKIAEYKIKQANKRLKLTLDAGKMAWWEESCCDGKIISCGKIQNLGFSDNLQNFDTQILRNSIYPDDLLKFDAEKDLFIHKQSNELNSEFRIKSANNEWHWFQYKGLVSETDGSGLPTRLIGVAYNITARKEFENNMAFLSQSASTLITLPDEDAIYDFLGTNLNRIVPNSIITISDLDIDNKTVQLNKVFGFKKMWIDKVINFLGINPLKYKYKFNNEKDIPTLLSGKLIDNDEKFSDLSDQFLSKKMIGTLEKLIGINKVYNIGIVRDKSLFAAVAIITQEKSVVNNPQVIETFIQQAAAALQKKQLEEEIFRQKEQAEIANRAKSIFLANMSHEIRTPMNAVLGFADILDKQIDEQVHKNYINSIKTSGKTLLNIINDILDLSKIEAGKVDIHLEPIDIRLMLNEMYSIFNLKAQEKKIEFKIFVANTVPQYLLCDDLHLRQILLNLISNAIKFTHVGYVEVNITFETSNLDTTDLYICVKDTGIGIQKESQASIFEAFMQQDQQDNRRYGGTGLGLTITKRLLQMMNGEITLVSEPGVGSTFLVRLNDIKPTVCQITQNATTIDYHTIVFDKATVLIVDDVESNRNVIKGYLNRYALNLLEAQNGIEAITKVAEFKPDIILMDLRMPEMNGYEATKRIKMHKSLKNIPIIAVTASAFDTAKDGLKNHNFDGYLRKPILTDELIGELTKHLKYKIENFHTDYALLQIQLTDNNATKLPQIIARLEQIYQERWIKLQQLQSIREMKEFIDNLCSIGDEYEIKAIKDYTEKLTESVNSFDVNTMQELLMLFPKLIANFKTVKCQ